MALFPSMCRWLLPGISILNLFALYYSIAYDVAVLSVAFFIPNQRMKANYMLQKDSRIFFSSSVQASFLSLRQHFAKICSQNVLNSEEAEYVIFTYTLQIYTNGVTVISSEN